MDFVVGFPRTPSSKNSIWVIIDRLTKSAHFLPVTNTQHFEKVYSVGMGPTVHYFIYVFNLIFYFLLLLIFCFVLFYFIIIMVVEYSILMYLIFLVSVGLWLFSGLCIVFCVCGFFNFGPLGVCEK